jgi:hypothetical protein
VAIYIGRRKFMATLGGAAAGCSRCARSTGDAGGLYRRANVDAKPPPGHPFACRLAPMPQTVRRTSQNNIQLMAKK